MAEAHSAAALSFSLTHDGVSVSYDQELLREIWHSFARGYRRRVARFKTNFASGIFPGNLQSFVAVFAVVAGFFLLGVDATFGVIWLLRNYVVFGPPLFADSLAVFVGAGLLWLGLIQLVRLSLKALLTYKGWMYVDVGQKVPMATKIWLGILHTISRWGPMLHSFQGALPHLPLPSLDDTVAKHLESLRPITTDEEYRELEKLSERFRRGLGRRLQRYLTLKSWLSTNYVTDWWEEFVYLRQRDPIMINSNYYGMDTLNHHPTTNQAARAANVTYCALLFRRLIDRQEVSPFSISPRSKVPFCTMQYERLFNSCRLPGDEVDRWIKVDGARHIAVYCRGCWFKVNVYSGQRLLDAVELQHSFERVIEIAEKSEPAPGERHLAALTAGDRTPWAKARREFFGSGVNKTSLHAIERSAFVVILDDEEQHYDPADPSTLDRWAHNLLHGRAFDRWFDKSFNLIISHNGHVGTNTEHSWGDAAVMAHFVEYYQVMDAVGDAYDPATGRVRGEPAVRLEPERLQWKLPDEGVATIERSLAKAQTLIADVEMALLVWTDYGKGLMKRLRVSPDAFLQMTLQLAYFRNQDHFALTYEASMTRLYREGRTETVRSCTMESCDFVRAMRDPTKSREERLNLLRAACSKHQNLYREAMCGRGIDRHLFALYVIKRYLEEESPLFDRIFPPTYLLSTSQTPLNQCEDEMKGMSADRRFALITAGGGFGPVADRGYGVSYIIAGEDQVSFHISSKRSADNTSSARFREDLKLALHEMGALLEQKPQKN